MTSKEALAIIKDIQEFEESCQNPYDDKIGKKPEYREEFSILEKLVERDTPIKIKHENNGIPYCAICERSYLHDTRGNQNNFCGYCGQRLDWSE